MQKIFRNLEQVIAILDHRITLAGSMLVVIFCGWLDYLTGSELSLFLLYLLPISVTAWFVGSRSALTISVVSAITWAISNRMAGEVYSHTVLEIWNALIRLGVFAIVSLLLSYLKQSLDRERKLSRTDFLTGITNSRAFHELALNELNRARRYRHLITVAYIDLDNFKQINDGFGHSVGDALLKMVADTMLGSLRKTDIVARLGEMNSRFCCPSQGGRRASWPSRNCGKSFCKK